MLRKLVLLILFYLGNLLCFAQDSGELPFYLLKKPMDSGEKITLETDRHFYCINEKLFFRAEYKFNNQMEGISWSKVLYVELIRWNGEKIVQAKYKLNDKGSSGYLIIPTNVLSGNYYLRAYTKWMRNFQGEDYAYKKIKVFNPFESNIDDGKTNESDKDVIYLKPVKDENLNDIKCFTNKNSYKQRDKIELTLLLDKTEHDGSDFCISVAKTGIIDTNSFYIQIPEKSLSIENNLTCLPELRGISISGRIVNANSQIPIANTLLNLSITKGCKYFSTFQTKNNGLFYFTLPEFYGIYDFYLEAVNDSDEIAEILIDQGFCNRSIQLNYIPFALDENEKEVAQEMMINMQLANIYNDSSRISIADSTSLPFFGSPERVYYTKDYIKLPNLEEFFFEIVKEVRIVYRKKQAFLKLAELNYFQKLDPLILIDNVTVVNGSDFIKMPLDKIKRIEIINKPYIVASKRYNGVIRIVTKNEDLAGIKLNNNSLFFSYSLFSDGSFIAPDYNNPIQNSRVADRRNLLFWDPYFELKSNQPKKLSFYSSDSKGEYIVYIRSLNDDGLHRIYCTRRIMVE
jgi:hypothetical protein